jgi:hypothetical protein
LTALLTTKASPFVAASERERLTLAHLARLTYAAFPSTYKCFYHTTAQQWVLQRRETGMWTGHAVEDLYTTAHALVEALASAHTRPGMQDARARTRLRTLASEMLARQGTWLPLFRREAFHEVTPTSTHKARKASRASCSRAVPTVHTPAVEPECVRLAKAMARRRREGQPRVPVRRSVRQANTREKRKAADAERRRSQRAARLAAARWGGGRERWSEGSIINMFVVVQFSVVSRFSVCKNAGFVESESSDPFEGASSWGTQPNFETYGGQCVELIAQTHTPVECTWLSYCLVSSRYRAWYERESTFARGTTI